MRMKRRIMIVISILACLIAGCGKPEKPEVPKRSATQEVFSTAEAENGGQREDTVSWQASYLRLEHPYDLALKAGNVIYGCLQGEGKVQIDQIEEEKVAAAATLTLPEVSEISGLAADREGNVYLLENKEGSVGLWKANGGDRLPERIELELEECEEADDLSLKGIATDSRGYFYIWCEMMVSRIETLSGDHVWHYVDRVYVKDGQLQTLFFEEVDDIDGTQVLNFQVDTEDTPFFVVKDREGIYIQEIDVGQRGLKEAVRLDKAAGFLETSSAGDMEHLGSADRGFLYCQGNELFEFCLDTQKTERLLNLTTYGIFSSDILYLAKNGSEIEIIDNHGEAGGSELISLALGAPERRTITLGTVTTVQDLERIVGEFNRYNSEYRVEIVDYKSRTGSYEEARERLKLDLVTGKAPEVIAVAGIDSRMLSEKGVLADLYDFMRTDAECSPDMLVQSVAKACEEGGHLYSVAPNFQLHSMWGYDDVIDGRGGIGFSELSQMLEACGKDVNAIAGFSADEPVLTRLCALFMDAFVDWENGTCDFEGEYFKEVLSFAKEYKGSGANGPVSEQIRKREVVLSVGIISSVADYQIQQELYAGTLAWVGYPVTEGTGTAVDFRGSAVAINAKKEDLTGAWEFVKYYLLQGYDGQGFPIVQEAFDQEMAAAMEDEYITEENGAKERFPKEYYNDGGGNIAVYAATQEEVDAVIRLIEGVEYRFSMHLELQNIINEEAEAYFVGQADLERTAEIIQNRVGLLLQETLG